MRAQVFIPNPSPMTIQLGDVTQDVYVGDQKIATALIPNLELKPGDNLIPMSSISDQAKVIGLISTQFKDGMVPVDIKGNSSIFNGQHLPYFEAALRAQTLHTTLNLGPALKGIGLDISKIGGGGSSGTSSSGSSSSALPSTSPSSAPVVSSIVPPPSAPTPSPARSPPRA
jgi:hypothetical protein